MDANTTTRHVRHPHGGRRTMPPVDHYEESLAALALAHARKQVDDDEYDQRMAVLVQVYRPVR